MSEENVQEAVFVVSSRGIEITRKAVERFQAAVNDLYRSEQMSEKALERATLFTREIYFSNFCKVIEDILGENNINSNLL